MPYILSSAVVLLNSLCLLFLLLPCSFSAEELRDSETGALRCTYTISPASRLSAQAPAGIIYALHPNGGSDGPMVSHTRSMLRAMGAGDDYFVVAPKSIGRSWTTSFDANNPDIGNIRALHENLIRRYPIDQRRVFVWGFSGGGMTASLLALHHPGMIHSTASFGGYGFDVPKVNDPLLEAPLFFSACGDQDPNLRFFTNAIPKQQASGLHWIHYTLAGVGHRMSGPAQDALLQDFLMLALQRRVESIPLREEDADRIEEIQSLFEKNGRLSDRQALQDLHRIGGRTAGAITTQMLRSEHAGTVSDGLRLIAAGAHTPSAIHALAELAQGNNQRLAGAAVQILAPLARWRYIEAEQSLAGLLIAENLNLRQRQDVLTAIAEALRLVPLGPRRDQEVLWQAIQLAAEGDTPLAHRAQQLLRP